MHYFIGDRGRKLGPFTKDQIEAKIAMGDLTAERLVWHSGLDGWKKLGECDEFRRLLDAEARRDEAARFEESPEPSVYADAAERQREEEEDAAMQRPRPWVRLGARYVDALLFASPGIVFLTKVQPGGWPGTPEDSTIALVANLALMVSVALWEAASFKLFGTTPGKALFRVDVREASGEPLNFVRAAQRSLFAVAFGMGMLMLPVLVLGHIIGYMALKTRRVAWWDDRLGTVVRHGPVGADRAFLAVGIVFLWLMLLGMAVSPEAAGILEKSGIEWIKPPEG
ncbi:MAG: RDD family protein [Verrucomicrobiales bacterium]